MDVTSGRNAVATLLEGRMGMVCELQYGRYHGMCGPVEIHVESRGHPYRTTTKTSIVTSQTNEFDDGMAVASRTSSPKQMRHSDQPLEQKRSMFDSVDVHANHEALSLQGTNNYHRHDRNGINQTWNLHLRGLQTDGNTRSHDTKRECCTESVPIENGTSTFYRHLCSEDDPPRSVSICPQRRCVAFGCSAGIELHWIDALTGQSLSRWFPLTAPSDYLFFLPPRPGFESAKKLRLISSAAHPDDRPAICRKFLVGRPTMSAFWGNFGFESSSRPLGASSCDHYHAVPLSDGHHVLFIDPLSNKLYMGCDAPLGGSTKLLRKVMFIPPREGSVPQLYTATTDLSWGARVIVAFGDNIVLYSVPPDVCKLSKTEQKAESWDVYTTPPFSLDGRSENHWLNWMDESHEFERPSRNPIWPIAIRGTEVGTLRGVCELAIFTQPDFTIWAFSIRSHAKAWKMRTTVHPDSQNRRYICRSGIVHEGSDVDEARDFIKPSGLSDQNDEEATSLQTESSVGFDGHLSQTLLKRIPRALSIENDEWVDFLDVRGCGAWYDRDGDVIMSDGDTVVQFPWAPTDV